MQDKVIGAHKMHISTLQTNQPAFTSLSHTLALPSLPPTWLSHSIPISQKYVFRGTAVWPDEQICF